MSCSLLASLTFVLSQIVSERQIQFLKRRSCNRRLMGIRLVLTSPVSTHPQSRL